MREQIEITACLMLFSVRAWTQIPSNCSRLPVAHPIFAEHSLTVACTSVGTVSIAQLRRQNDHKMKRMLREAETLSQQGEHQAAIELFNRVLDADPCYSEARNNRALQLVALGNCHSAIEELTLLLEIDPGFRLAYTNLGVVLCNHHEYKKAESVLRKGIDLFGEWPKASLTLGVALVGQYGWTREARELLVHSASQDKAVEAFLRSWPDFAKQLYRSARTEEQGQPH